jgi:peptidyl-prolyl cis-trans isomerase A (cyclophilin A)
VKRATALLALALLALAGCGDAGGNGAVGNDAASLNVATPGPALPKADKVRVRLETEAGAIDLELDAKHAPVTTANFLQYVDEHRLDGTFFYRAARTPGAPGRGLVQGGVRREYRRMLAPIAHEPTDRTGLRHVDGTVSMARAGPGTAMGDFFITVGAMPELDAGPGHKGEGLGFAAFGRVVGGMDAVRRILAKPTIPNAGRGPMRGQMIAAPVRIVGVKRVQ